MLGNCIHFSINNPTTITLIIKNIVAKTFLSIMYKRLFNAEIPNAKPQIAVGITLINFRNISFINPFYLYLNITYIITILFYRIPSVTSVYIALKADMILLIYQMNFNTNM